MIFHVALEKRYTDASGTSHTLTGSVAQEAPSLEQARARVTDRIDWPGRLGQAKYNSDALTSTHPDIQWDAEPGEDWEYVDYSFGLADN